METHRVQEDLEGVHHEEHSHHREHVEEAQDEEVEGDDNFVAVSDVVASLSEDDRDEDLTELTVGKRKRPETQVRRSVGDATQDELDGLNDLVDENFASAVVIFSTL